jgi:hypothetical protein
MLVMLVGIGQRHEGRHFGGDFFMILTMFPVIVIVLGERWKSQQDRSRQQQTLERLHTLSSLFMGLWFMDLWFMAFQSVSRLLPGGSGTATTGAVCPT